MLEQQAVRIFESVIAQGGPTPEDYAELIEALNAVHQYEFEVISGRSERIAVNDRFRQLLSRHPTIFSEPATMQGFAKAKPHGYSGDFEMIERIYGRHMAASPSLKKWDEFFHAGSAATAVSNRGEFLARLLQDHGPSTLLSVGCGPGIDVLIACIKTAKTALPRMIHLLDNDLKAIKRSQEIVSPIVPTVTIEFHHKNALRFRSATEYDLIWSSGLFDYLNDKTASFLLGRLYSMLSSSGALVIGNFSSWNPDRAYMEVIGDWFLIHRDQAGMCNLAKQAGISADDVSIGADPTGVNLFLICSKS